MKETSLNVDAEHWWGSIIGGAFGAECAVKYVIYDRRKRGDEESRRTYEIHSQKYTYFTVFTRIYDLPLVRS